ncbi:MAG: sigma 54-interacting transcriptional regulator [Gammaproteobacteria bacterium]
MYKQIVLIAGNDSGWSRTLAARLLQEGYEVIESLDPTHALQTWQNVHPDVLVIGPSEDGTWDGVDLLHEIRHREKRLSLLLVNSHSSESEAIRERGARINDNSKAPDRSDSLLTSMVRNLSNRPSPRLAEPVSSRTGGHAGLVGDSVPMARIKTYVEQLSGSDSNVLITGETGTGKERVAELIHQRSARQAKPLVPINCAALPESLLESELFGYERGAFTGASTAYDGRLKLADGGTVFFDEIGDLSPYAQAKILRVIENKECYRLGGKRSITLDFRVIAATNQDLEGLVAENKFRKDLFFRINVARIHLSPLRDRREDIPLLVDHYLQAHNARLDRRIEGPSPEAWACLLRYEWPGNVRELKNVLEALLITRDAGPITLMDLPECVRRHRDARESATSIERELLLSALSAAKWNKSKAAQQLHWSRMTLYRKMAKYHIEETQPDPRGIEASCNSPAPPVTECNSTL